MSWRRLPQKENLWKHNSATTRVIIRTVRGNSTHFRDVLSHKNIYQMQMNIVVSLMQILMHIDSISKNTEQNLN
jgi:hypothetical protein